MEISPIAFTGPYGDDASDASQTAPEVRKRLTVRDGEGNGLSFLIPCSETEFWKREGREQAGEVQTPVRGPISPGRQPPKAMG